MLLPATSFPNHLISRRSFPTSSSCHSSRACIAAPVRSSPCIIYHLRRASFAVHYHSRLVRASDQHRTMSGSAKAKAAAGKQPRKPPMEPRPSSSVLLISPANQILLLHRVQTSTSFASAHVFPGGNVSAFHDGMVPEPGHPQRHVDNRAYRMAAIRETFEESGILLAKDKSTGQLLSVSEAEREEGRKLIHGAKISFPEWLEGKGGIPDIGMF
jgi:hypothetical protein